MDWIGMQLPVTIEATEDLEEFFSFCDAWLCYPDCDSNDLYWDDNNDLQINFRDWAAHMEEFELAFDRNGRYILTDFMGSVVGVVHNGNAIEITYNAWGDPNYSGDIEGLSILWNGYYYDSETGNYYLKNRYYSPLERKFITQDPRGINPDENWNNRLYPKVNILMVVDCKFMFLEILLIIVINMVWLRDIGCKVF